MIHEQECDICGTKLKSIQGLRQHKKRVHGIEYEQWKEGKETSACEPVKCDCDDEHVCGICHKKKGYTVTEGKLVKRHDKIYRLRRTDRKRKE